jgi:hypothetical protein
VAVAAGAAVAGAAGVAMADAVVAAIPDAAGAVVAGAAEAAMADAVVAAIPDAAGAAVAGTAGVAIAVALAIPHASTTRCSRRVKERAVCEASLRGLVARAVTLRQQPRLKALYAAVQ